MEKDVFCQWLENSVIPHKQLVNPNDFSQLILDDHGSWFSVEAIELCKENKIEMLCYPGHLTHILQGPDVVLNKPISSVVDKMIHNKPIVSGKSDISRIAFMKMIVHAVKTVCTKENVLKTFSATRVISFNSNKIDLSQFPSSLAGTDQSGSPIKATCSLCRSQDVELYPLIKQGIIPKHLAQVFTYTPPPSKPKSQCKVVKKACVITSEPVKAEIQTVENKWKGVKSTQKDVSEETPTSLKSKSKLKTPQIVSKERENISELSADKSSEDDKNVDFEFSDIVTGDYGFCLLCCSSYSSKQWWNVYCVIF